MCDVGQRFGVLPTDVLNAPEELIGILEIERLGRRPPEEEVNEYGE